MGLHSWTFLCAVFILPQVEDVSASLLVHRGWGTDGADLQSPAWSQAQMSPS